MMTALRAELRKIFSVRSTYVIILIALLLSVALVSFWVYGYKDVGHAAINPGALRECLLTAINVGGVLLGFLALLSVGHEYRYNTILYSITINNRRTKIFISKLVALVFVTLVATVIIILLGAAAFYLGQHLHQVATLTPTSLNFDFLWRSLVTVEGGVLLAYVIAMLVRSQVLSIVLYLLLPTTLEGLLSLILKENVKYLPFTALGNITAAHGPMTPLNAAALVGAYVAGFGLLAWVLFLRRDAS